MTQLTLLFSVVVTLAIGQPDGPHTRYASPRLSMPSGAVLEYSITPLRPRPSRADRAAEVSHTSVRFDLYLDDGVLAGKRLIWRKDFVPRESDVGPALLIHSIHELAAGTFAVAYWTRDTFHCDVIHEDIAGNSLMLRRTEVHLDRTGNKAEHRFDGAEILRGDVPMDRQVNDWRFSGALKDDTFTAERVGQQNAKFQLRKAGTGYIWKRVDQNVEVRPSDDNAR
jgi:hypothetical protein